MISGNITRPNLIGLLNMKLSTYQIISHLKSMIAVGSHYKLTFNLGFDTMQLHQLSVSFFTNLKASSVKFFGDLGQTTPPASLRH